jgi:hypothetical protein
MFLILEAQLAFSEWECKEIWDKNEHHTIGINSIVAIMAHLRKHSRIF